MLLRDLTEGRSTLVNGSIPDISQKEISITAAKGWWSKLRG